MDTFITVIETVFVFGVLPLAVVLVVALILTSTRGGPQ